MSCQRAFSPSQPTKSWMVNIAYCVMMIISHCEPFSILMFLHVFTTNIWLLTPGLVSMTYLLNPTNWTEFLLFRIYWISFRYKNTKIWVLMCQKKTRRHLSWPRHIDWHSANIFWWQSGMPINTLWPQSAWSENVNPVLGWYVWLCMRRHDSLTRTSILLRDTQQSEGKSCSMGTRNCRQPSQWHSSSIIPIRLKIRITALARS